jgi:hypothetical protein
MSVLYMVNVTQLVLHMNKGASCGHDRIVVGLTLF